MLNSAVFSYRFYAPSMKIWQGTSQCNTLSQRKKKTYAKTLSPEPKHLEHSTLDQNPRQREPDILTDRTLHPDPET